jgi:hypothetical protein
MRECLAKLLRLLSAPLVETGAGRASGDALADSREAGMPDQEHGQHRTSTITSGVTPHSEEVMPRLPPASAPVKVEKRKYVVDLRG